MCFSFSCPQTRFLMLKLQNICRYIATNRDRHGTQAPRAQALVAGQLIPIVLAF